MRATIGLKIFAGYAVALVAILVLLLGALSAIQQVEDALKAEDSIRVLVEVLEDTEDFFVAAMRAQRTFLITMDQIHLAELEAAEAKSDANFELIREAAAEAGSTIDTVELKAVGRALFNQLAEEAALAGQNSTGRSSEIVARRSVDQIQELERLIQSVQDRENTRVDSIVAAAVNASEHLRAFIVNGSLVALVAVLLAAFLVTRNISRPIVELEQAAARIAAGDLTTKPRAASRTDEVGSLSASFIGMVSSLRQLIAQVQRSGVQVNSASVEISATAKQQQTTASEVATTTNEVGATAREMSATSAELLRTVEGVSAVAEQASELAETGKEGLQTMEKTMRGILEAAGAITAKLGVMNEKASNISTVVTTITKVADQTNLLSLNAAIEAEKAGEYGRGFSVVAAEIRRLADQTAASTGDIEMMVKEMTSAVSSGVMGMDKFAEELRKGATDIATVGTQLDRIIGAVQSLAPNIETVNDGMRSQAQGSSQISEALGQLGDAARMMSDSIRESVRAIDQLNEATQGLQSGILKFKLADS